MKTSPRFPPRLICVLAVGLIARAIAATAAEPDPRMAAPSKGAVAGKLPAVPPTPPAEAAKKFRVLDGFRMDLLAAEPLVASPVAMAYDENGRAYVCEMRDYPYTDKARHKAGQENPTDRPIGRVRLLEDVDGDGTFDKASVFAEGLSWPTGVACWKGGVFIAATPDVWYCKDTDGDGKADERRKVLTGFRKLNVQAVMNTLVWGLDNRIHGAGGSNGGQIRPGDQADAQPTSMTRSDFSIDPTTGEFRLLSGGARFGGSFDDWGNRFLCNIRNPAQHVVLPSKYLARNTSLAAPSPIADIAEFGDQLPVYSISPPEPWRVLRAQRWAGERDIVMPRSELVGAGVVTSASGVTSYRGAAYPEKYHGNLFIAECAANLFYRLELRPDGVTFKAARADGKAEMVASTDNWFRPVNFTNAPDGTLHVLDMYRENIEHPWSIPEDIHAAVDLEAGRDMGRLWRLTPPGFKPAKRPRLGEASSAELVATLENPNSWWRETAQRLLFERQDKSIVAALHDLVKQGRTPQARLHALWTLEGLNELHDEDLLFGLNDQVAGVRENAVRLAEGRAQDAAIVPAILARAEDTDARVRFQTAFTLGELSDPRAFDALAAVARRDAADPWTRTAVLSSVADTADQLLVRLLTEPTFRSSPAATDLIRELAQIVGVRGKQVEMQRVLEAVGDGGERNDVALRVVITGIGQGLKRSGKNLRRSGLTGDASRVVDDVLSEAARVAVDGNENLETRTAAVRLLAFDDFERVKAPLSDLLATGQPQDVQRAAIAVLGGFTTPDAVPPLLANWRTQTPAVRSEVVAAMLGVRARALPLLKAVESGLIPANQIPFDQRRILALSSVPEVKELATKLFSGAAPGPRKDVIKKYQAALEVPGDVARGRLVFEKACIACHRAGDFGTKDTGPNLATIRAWNPEQLLINILDPNREVAPNFVSYTVATADGRLVTGIIADDGAAGLTIKRADGVTETVLRRDIDEILGTGLSLMPEGVENTVSQQSMADLIAFLLAPASKSDR